MDARFSHPVKKEKGRGKEKKKILTPRLTEQTHFEDRQITRIIMKMSLGEMLQTQRGRRLILNCGRACVYV